MAALRSYSNHVKWLIHLSRGTKGTHHCALKTLCLSPTTGSRGPVMERPWACCGGGGCGGGCGGRRLEIHLRLLIRHQGAPEALSGVGVRLRSAHPVAPQRLGARRLQVAHACLGCDSLQASELVCARATAKGKVRWLRWLPKVLLPASEALGAF